MRMTRFGLLLGALALPLAQPAFAAPQAAPASAGYRNFQVAIYVTVRDTIRLADPATFAADFARASSQLHFDHVYVEAYRDGTFATDAQLEAVKREFEAKGVRVSGGITLAKGGSGGQFGTFDYEDPADRAECERAVRLAAKHFDEVILDDFFFFNSKSDADIAAKGDRSWSQYRLETMRKVSQELVLGPAKAVNPRVRMIIKYPNWYEHFQGSGYDLDKQSQMFDAIYTGTETRDPAITDQLLQQYESYEIVRYFDHVRPGGNLGGWMDTYDVHSADRYAEQIWDTAFAKAPEITLFNWHPMSEAAGIDGGTRPWADAATSFDWDAIARAWRKGHDTPPGWGRAAGAALGIADRVVGALGTPIGIASYKPYQSSGEDFLHNYLGNIGLPIELYPTFPADAQTILLTEAAAGDPRIVEEMKAALKAGKTLIVTSGLVEALQDRGFRDIAEWTPTGNSVLIDHYVNGFGAGAGTRLDDPAHPGPKVLFPEVRFYTNDSWGIIRGVASAKGFPIMLMDHYSKGTILMLTVPENMGDLYNLPQAALTQIKRYAMADFPVRIDAPAKVALFAYDNGAFIVENYRDEPATVGISVAGAAASLSAIGIEQTLTPVGGAASDPGRTEFTVTLPAHSFRAFRR
ncbi:MAG TPA: hypothetical protein VFT56_05295 [Sphingomonas sp.]|nr:hypothetical protein [Sphingomonas sp.]